MVPRRGAGSTASSSWIPLSCGTSTRPIPTLPAGRQVAPLGVGGGPVTARPLSPPPPLMTLATRRPPGRRRSESPEFAPVPSCSRSLPAAAPGSEALQSRCSGGAIMTRQAARRLAPVRNQESPASLQRPGRRSTRGQDFPKDTYGNSDV